MVTFIPAKRREIASLTAKIETKLTRQGDPAVGGEHEERVHGCRTVVCRSERRPWPAREIWKPRNSKPFTYQRSSMVSQSASTVEVELPNSDCGSRQAFVVASIRTVTYRLAMRWCAHTMRNLMEMTARSIKSFDEISAVKMIRSD